MKKTKIGILISGRGSNMVSIAEHIKEHNVPGEIALVFSNVGDAPGLKKAEELGIGTVSFSHKGFPSRKEFDMAVASELDKRDVELVCLAGFMRLLSKWFVRKYSNRIINIHPSLLPAFTGLDAQEQAFDWGAKVAGCTVHFVDEKLDHGPIILQRTVPVLNGDTADELSRRILDQEHKTYPEAVELYCRGRLKVDGRKVQIKSK